MKTNTREQLNRVLDAALRSDATPREIAEALVARITSMPPSLRVDTFENPMRGFVQDAYLPKRELGTEKGVDRIRQLLRCSHGDEIAREVSDGGLVALLTLISTDFLVFVRHPDGRLAVLGPDRWAVERHGTHDAAESVVRALLAGEAETTTATRPTTYHPDLELGVVEDIPIPDEVVEAFKKATSGEAVAKKPVVLRAPTACDALRAMSKAARATGFGKLSAGDSAVRSMAQADFTDEDAAAAIAERVKPFEDDVEKQIAEAVENDPNGVVAQAEAAFQRAEELFADEDEGLHRADPESLKVFLAVTPDPVELDATKEILGPPSEPLAGVTLDPVEAVALEEHTLVILACDCGAAVRGKALSWRRTGRGWFCPMCIAEGKHRRPPPDGLDMRAHVKCYAPGCIEWLGVPPLDDEELEELGLSRDELQELVEDRAKRNGWSEEWRRGSANGIDWHCPEHPRVEVTP